MKIDYQALEKIFEDEPETLALLQQREFLNDKKMGKLNGDKGDTGDVGERGEQGDRGEKGDKGDKGERGDKGDNGINGKDGKNGKDGVGKDGRNGVDGKYGKDGTSVSVKEVINYLMSLKDKEAEEFSKKIGSNIDISHIRNANSFMFKGTRYKIEELMHGAGAGNSTTTKSSSGDITAESESGVDYVYLMSGTSTLTMPTAPSNKNEYTIKNVGSGTVTVATTASQTIDGSSTALLKVQYTSVTLRSDGTNWNII